MVIRNVAYLIDKLFILLIYPKKDIPLRMIIFPKTCVIHAASVFFEMFGDGFMQF